MSEALVNLIHHSGTSPHETDEELVRSLFRSILLRDPEPDEETYSRELISKYGAIALARALWNTNEFLVLE
jgi:hypothetical protein